MDPVCSTGRLESARGLLLESVGPKTAVGDLCRLACGTGGRRILAEVVGFSGDRTLLMPLEGTDGVAPGTQVQTTGGPVMVPVGEGLLGRVLDGLGRPLDGKGPVVARARRPVSASVSDPVRRPLVHEPLPVGVKAIDGFMALGKGQRVGILGPGAAGKTSLLGQIARNTHADVNVIALIGERSREVREFIEECLGEEGLRRSVVGVVTAERPAAWRGGGWAARASQGIRQARRTRALTAKRSARGSDTARPGKLRLDEQETVCHAATASWSSSSAKR